MFFLFTIQKRRRIRAELKTTPIFRYSYSYSLIAPEVIPVRVVKEGICPAMAVDFSLMPLGMVLAFSFYG